MHARSATANPSSDRYAIFGEIASGGMATIQYGRAVAAGGFSRAVAIKRLHPQFAKDPAFVSMFLDEARLASRIAHINVVPTLDVLSGPRELAVVMEYVHGESLARLLRIAMERDESIPAPIAVTLIAGVLHGLDAAHETRDDQDEPLHIVHRDVSPENVLVGADGVARLIDFGIARAQGRSRMTPAGELKGKLPYMAVEQFKGLEVDRRVDVYGASVVLWEALTGRELFSGDSDAAVVNAVLQQELVPPSAIRPQLPVALDAIVMRGLSRERDERFATAREMALALERQIGVVPQGEVAEWLQQEVGDVLAQRRTMLRRQDAPTAFISVDDGLASTRPIITSHAEPDAAATSTSAPPLADARGRSVVRSKHPRPLLYLVGGVLAVVLLGAALALRLLRSDGAEPSRIVTEPIRPTHQAEPLPAPAVVREPAPAHTNDAAPAAQAPVEQPQPATQPAPAPRREPATAVPAETAAAHTETRTSTEPARPASRTDVGGRDRDKSRKHKAAKLDCNNPFVIDSRGIRRAKPECL